MRMQKMLWMQYTIIDEPLVQEKETKKKIGFPSNVKFEILHIDLLPTMEADMMCTIKRETFFSIARNTWIRDSGASCHITNHSGLYDVTNVTNWYRESQAVCLLQKRQISCEGISS